MGVAKVLLNNEVLMDVTQNTVASNNLLIGYDATGCDGELVEGGIENKQSSDLIISGATVIAPAGCYAEDASATLPIYDGGVT